MKSLKSSLGLLVALVLLGAGCGKGGVDDAHLGNANQGSCGSGMVQSSQYGCLPQGQCPAGMGLYNNQCVQANTQGNYNPNNPFGSNPYGAPNGGYGTPYPNYPTYPGQYPGQQGYPYFPNGGYPYPNQNTGSVCPSPYINQGGYCVYYYSPWSYTFYPQ